MSWITRFFSVFTSNKTAVDGKLPKIKDVNSADDRAIELSKILGFVPADLSLYQTALRHRSSTALEKYERYDSYERLEFLGDAVLDLISAELLFQNTPKKTKVF